MAGFWAGQCEEREGCTQYVPSPTPADQHPQVDAFSSTASIPFPGSELIQPAAAAAHTNTKPQVDLTHDYFSILFVTHQCGYEVRVL